MIEIELDEETQAKIEAIADEAGGIKVNSAIELILRQNRR